MLFNDKGCTRIYTNYAQPERLAVRRSSNLGMDGKLKYFRLACSRVGKGCNTSKNTLYPKPSSKTDCKTTVNTAACPVGQCRLNNVVLEDNHTLSLGKAYYYKSNKKWGSKVKSRPKLNDQAKIKVRKNFLSSYRHEDMRTWHPERKTVETT